MEVRGKEGEREERGKEGGRRGGVSHRLELEMR